MQEHLGWQLDIVHYPTQKSLEDEFWQAVKQRHQAGVTGPALYADLSLTRSEQGKMKVVPRRWVVERTFAWLGRNRRLSKDYEALPASSEAFVYLAMIRLMLKRLGKSKPKRDFRNTLLYEAVVITLMLQPFSTSTASALQKRLPVRCAFPKCRFDSIQPLKAPYDKE